MIRTYWNNPDRISRYAGRAIILIWLGCLLLTLTSAAVTYAGRIL